VESTVKPQPTILLCLFKLFYNIFSGVEKRVLKDIDSDIFFSNKPASVSSTAASSRAESVRDNNVPRQNDSDSDWDDMHGI